MAASPGSESTKRRASPRRTPKSTPAVAKGSRKPARPPAKRGPSPPPSPPLQAAAPATVRSQKLQKVLAQSGLGSRRAMEEIIKAGKVKVNGEPAMLGMRVTTEDLIQVGRRQIKFKVTSRLPRVIVYHKIDGEIVSRDDPQGRRSVFEKLPVIRSAKWLAVGRLDFNTGGLLIFTTSGELANRLMHPRFEVEREYAVRLFGSLTPAQVQELKSGVRLSDGEARFEVLEDQGGEGRNRWYRAILKEGRNRVVRRMFEALGLQVSRLMRVRFGIVALPPRLKRGNWIELKEAEISELLEWAGSAPGVADEDVSDAAPPPSAERQNRHRPKSRAR
ncbi:MAG: pseudouridine synthase [Betaproteobacteria bacterium]|nr:pseudouridine synthase [Betaproteobacteria bacterium]